MVRTVQLVVAVNRKFPGPGSVTLHVKGCKHLATKPPFVVLTDVPGIHGSHDTAQKHLDVFGHGDDGVYIQNCVPWFRDHQQDVERARRATT